ncbi:protein kinase [Paenibacillus sp. GCM10027628]|uniref:protein kinase n=1 Tax=Paenibacillus sp. GCM10027628 TaxID=3273413 RepID=UPI0036356FBE
MEDYKSISVAFRKGNHVEIVNNPTSYPLIGIGEQGAVFKISSDRCIKVFAKETDALQESKVLKVAQHPPIVPKLYEVGANYIIMEYMSGPSLDQYLKSKGRLSEKMTARILFLLKEMKQLQFTRLDASLRHIFVTKERQLKVIDHVNSFRVKSAQPERLLKELKKMNLLSSFLKQVKKIDPQSYREWKEYK